MFRSKFRYMLGLLALAGSLSSCKYFGEKTDISFIQPPVYSAKQVAYVPVQPVISGFQKPVDVIVGFDQLMYVADQATGEISYYDLSGVFMGKLPYRIPNLQAIAQDRKLDILAVGTYDTTITVGSESHTYTLAAIYRFDPKQNSGFGLKYDTSGLKRVPKIVHPFYFKSTLSEDDKSVRFQGVAALADNSYYVTRTGPSSSTTQTGGPDNAVLYFYNNDKFVSPVYVQTQTGLFSNYFQSPKAIVTLAQPPQSTSVMNRGDFLFTSLAPYDAFKVQAIAKISTDNGASYNQTYFFLDTTKASGYLYEPYRFISPTDVTVTGDGSNYMFVVDAEKDSLYQFNAVGLEGAQPPAASTSKKLVKVSFGGHGNTLTTFNHPMGVAYYNKIVYVADAGNGRILRFKLTTDIQ